MRILPTVAFCLLGAVLSPASAQVPEAERAGFVNEDIASCVQLQQVSLPRKSIPAAQYKAFCECRAAYLARNTTPADFTKFKEKSIPMRQVPTANNTCEQQIFGREL